MSFLLIGVVLGLIVLRGRSDRGDCARTSPVDARAP